MRILQLIDSLEPGGAERMAVNYANALAEKISFSGLVATRKEGELKVQIDPAVNYLFLDKRKALDPKAICKLKRYCQQNEIQFVHAHSSSFFLAVLLKCVYPKIKIIWHDHYGLSDFLENRRFSVLKKASFFFSGIIAVNDQLENWSRRNLLCKKIIRLNNFMQPAVVPVLPTKLSGREGCRVICVANWRPQKNIGMLIEAVARIRNQFPDWTFHLVGKDFKDSYAYELKSAIADKGLEEVVFMYDTVSDVQNVIAQSDIAVLTSLSEGLPVALLEYGWYAKPVIATAVGDIPKVIRNCESGLLVPSNDVLAFSKALVTLIQNQDLRSQFGNALRTEILKNYSEDAVINLYLAWVIML